MKRIIKVFLSVSMSMFLLVGCGNKIPNMDDTNQKMVVEYVADIVREHDLRHSSRLMEIETLQEALEEEAMLEAVFSKDYSTEINEENTEAFEKDESNTETKVNNSDSIIREETISLVDALSLEETDITYAGYEVTKSYPHDSENIYFSMDATSGNELVVLKFDITNTSQNDKMYDILSLGVYFKIIVNGESKTALTTMLLNDLTNYKGTIAAGAKEQLVIIGEIPEDKSQNISEISLSMKSKSGTVSITL